jgi:hypothetical protein
MLPPDLFAPHSVRCGEATVLLDLPTDSYLCRYDGGAPGAIDRSAPLVPQWHDPPPAEDGLTASDLRRFARAFAGALLASSGRTLQALLVHAAELERAPSPAAPPGLASLAARFERMSLYLPFRPSCLLHALALLHFLHAHGESADWVIGVQLFPFRAHCWLAVDAMLLGERAHLIEDYVPIYRLRRTPT